MEAGGSWRLPHFPFLSVIISLCSKKNRVHWQNPPKGSSGMKGMRWNCAEQEKLFAATACWVFASLVWKCFASYSQEKKAQRGEGLVQLNGKLTLPLLESNPLTWLKSIVFQKKSESRPRTTCLLAASSKLLSKACRLVRPLIWLREAFKRLLWKNNKSPTIEVSCKWVCQSSARNEDGTEFSNVTFHNEWNVKYSSI